MSDNILAHNRVILCHFDTYSTALLFARFGQTVLAPFPLPEAASPMPAPEAVSEQHSPGAALAAVVEHFALEGETLNMVEPYQAWMDTEQGPIRIHLARFNTFEAPRGALEPHGATFKPISELRGLSATDLQFLRQAFNLIMGGG